MGSKKKYRDLLGRNKKFVAGLAALMMCCGAFLASGRLLPDKTVNGDIPLHDGDVLVDSLNVDHENGASNKKSSKSKEGKSFQTCFQRRKVPVRSGGRGR